MSIRRNTGDAGKWGITENESVDWRHDRTRYTTYTNSAAQSVPLARLIHPRRRQERSSRLLVGCSASGIRRRLSANAGKTKNNNPEENFESSAPAKAKPTLMTSPREGLRHMFGSCHTVSTQNNVTARSVMTNGPKARKAGIVVYAARHSKPPQKPPSWVPMT